MYAILANGDYMTSIIDAHLYIKAYTILNNNSMQPIMYCPRGHFVITSKEMIDYISNKVTIFGIRHIVFVMFLQTIVVVIIVINVV